MTAATPPPAPGPDYQKLAADLHRAMEPLQGLRDALIETIESGTRLIEALKKAGQAP